MNLIIWNCRCANGPDFIRNFRTLLDWHKPPMMLDEFPFNKMTKVPTMGNSGGLVVLWDDNLLELDEIATTGQEIHAMIKVSTHNKY
ncbi:hypothetical protein R3W88_016681 [Solanum pinnatisectum]|uniref:Uncharacterized protein n=1 Tax=Solanum pinnatisectum TaxID=50273 RepID=A0AAV9KY85_9SOLN|nr:hypothetical protein R3W88_016681 [Solanum pinnatisectum]